MGTPAIVATDKIVGTCSIHQIPNPTSGSPQPAPPMPFSAPIAQSVVPKVLIGGKPAAVVGSSGLNTPPHVGLHPSDKNATPPTQIGRITSGSATVLIGGKPAATQSSQCTLCVTPGKAVPSVMTVLIG